MLDCSQRSHWSNHGDGLNQLSWIHVKCNHEMAHMELMAVIALHVFQLCNTKISKSLVLLENQEEQETASCATCVVVGYGKKNGVKLVLLQHPTLSFPKTDTRTKRKSNLTHDSLLYFGHIVQISTLLSAVTIFYYTTKGI